MVQMANYAHINKLIEASFIPQSSRFRHPKETRSKTRLKTISDDPRFNDLVLGKDLKLTRPATLAKLAQANPDQADLIAQEAVASTGRLATLLDQAFEKRRAGNSFIKEHSSFNDKSQQFTLHVIPETNKKLSIATPSSHLVQQRLLLNDEHKASQLGIDLIRKDQGDRIAYQIKLFSSCGEPMFDFVEFSRDANAYETQDESKSWSFKGYSQVKPQTAKYELAVNFNHRDGKNEVSGKLPQNISFNHRITNAQELVSTLNLRSNNFDCAS